METPEAQAGNSIPVKSNETQNGEEQLNLIEQELQNQGFASDRLKRKLRSRPTIETGNSFLQKIKDWEYWTPIGVFTYNVSKILLTLGLAVLAGFYAFAVTSAMPVLFGGGIVLAVVFGFYAISNMITLYKTPQKDKNTKFKPAIFRSCGTVVLGLALAALGVLLLVAQPFMGALFGVGIAVKIGLIVAGALFVAKGISDGIIQTRQPEGKLKNIFARLPHFLLNIVPAALGILAIVVGISTGILYLPIAIVAIFAMRFASHISRALSKSTKTEEKAETEKPLISSEERKPSMRIVLEQKKANNEEDLASVDGDELNSQNKCMTAARVLDNLSLMAIGGGLIVAGALFAAPLAVAIGIPVLFAQIPLLVIGSLSALMGLTKFFIGPMIELREDEINLIAPSFGSKLTEINDINNFENNNGRDNNREISAGGKGSSEPVIDQ